MPLSLFHSPPNQPKVNSPQSSLQGTNEVTRVNCTVCVNCSSVSDSKHTGGSATSMAVGFFMDANMKHSFPLDPEAMCSWGRTAFN